VSSSSFCFCSLGSCSLLTRLEAGLSCRRGSFSNNGLLFLLTRLEGLFCERQSERLLFRARGVLTEEKPGSRLSPGSIDLVPAACTDRVLYVLQGACGVKGTVFMLQLATGRVWCFVAGELEEDGDNKCNVGKDVSKRYGNDKAGLHGLGWTYDEGNFIMETAVEQASC
jgi:hypothetical protein